ncbi:hypothetical protein [Streptomyces sp. NRRL B-24484]|uniref:hypothetical protein n=1 Tax=Streptomyces sp. NRRL B-24484 TaxID=1463833 RepID=UPI000693E484|nr:hypothetical protein [Streptomyces sp. NRRL B-24484]
MLNSRDTEPTPAMNDSLLTALTSQGHAVHGNPATVAGLVRRGLAQPLTDGQSPSFRLTEAGRLAASEIARAAHGAAYSQVWADALAEARRLLRLGDDERTQPARQILTWPATRETSTDAGVKDAERAQRWMARAILAGATCRRLDPEGRRVECVHLTGIANEFIAADHDPAGTGGAESSKVTARQD